MTAPTYRQEEQKLAPSAIVMLFEVDATSIGGELYRFVPMVNEKDLPVIWQGNEYAPYPCKVEGFDWTGVGPIPRPTLTFANVTGFVTALCLAFDDMVGAKITRKLTMVKYLDGVNFGTGGNPNADPNAHWPDEIFFVDRKIGENKNQVAFELTSSFDLQGVKLPRRFVVQNVCVWKYRSAECSYAGGAVAKADDTPTADINLDSCGKRLASCKLRFGAEAPLPFGAFPGVGMIRG